MRGAEGGPPTEGGPGSGDMWGGLAPPTAPHTSEAGLADSREIRTNSRNSFTTQGQGPGLISFINNESFINKVKTNSQQEKWGQNSVRKLTEKEIQVTGGRVKILDLTHN